MSDFINVLGTLPDPTRCDFLYIYIITNFNFRKQAFISNFAVNHLKIFLIGAVRGVVFGEVTNTALVAYDKTGDTVSPKIHRTIQFDTNDDIDVLLKNKDVGFCFTVNQKGTKKHPVPLYILESCEQYDRKAFKDVVPSPDVKAMPQPQKYFALQLKNIEKLINTPLTQLDVSIIPYLPTISSIDGISYEIPINSVYQTLTVYGNLYNDRTGAYLYDIPIPLTVRPNPDNIHDFSGTGPVAFLPVLCDVNNLSAPAQLHIRNFDLRYQLPFDTIKSVGQGNDPFNLFDTDTAIYQSIFSDDGDGIGQSLLKLFKELFIYSGLYRNNFNIWDDQKSNPDFQNFFNTTFANKTAFEFAQEILEKGLLENTGVEQRIGDLNINHLKWEKFQALCLACSSFLVSPFSGNAGESKEHRNFLWYYLEFSSTPPSTPKSTKALSLADLVKQIKSCFNKKGILVYDNFANLGVWCRVFSNFFKGEEVKISGTAPSRVLKSKVKSISHAEINVSELEKITAPPLPDMLTTLNENGDPAVNEPVVNKLKYLCNLIVYEQDIEKLLSLGTFKRTETMNVPFSFEKNIIESGKSVITPPTPDFTLSDLKSMLPITITDTIFLKDINNEYHLDFSTLKREEDFKKIKNQIKLTVSTPQTSYVYRDCSDQYDEPATHVINMLELLPARHGANIPNDKAHCRVGYDTPASNNVVIFNITGGLVGGLINMISKGLFDYDILKQVAQKCQFLPHKGSEELRPRDIISTTYYWTYRFEAQLTIKTNCINNFAYLDSFELRHLLNRGASAGRDNVVITFELNEEVKNAGGAIIGINRDQHVGFFNSAKKLIIGYSYFSQDEKGDGIYKNGRIVKKQKSDEAKTGDDKESPQLTFTKLFTTEEGDLNFNFQKNHPATVKTEHRY